MKKHPLCPKNDENTLKVIVDTKKESKRDANHMVLFSARMLKQLNAKISYVVTKVIVVLWIPSRSDVPAKEWSRKDTKGERNKIIQHAMLMIKEGSN